MRDGRGRAGGFPATPSSTLGRPGTASSFKEQFSLCSKAFEPLAVPGAPACFPGSECGVTPLPQFPRPYEPQCKPLPAAAGVKFCFLPTHPGWVGSTAQNHLIIAAAQLKPYHPSPQAGVPLGGETPTKEKWARSGQKKKRHRRRTKKQRTDFVKEVHFLMGRNRGEICRTSTG